MTIQGPPGNNSNHPEPIRRNGKASRAQQVPFATPLPVDHLLGKLFKYLTRCGRGARAVQILPLSVYLSLQQCSGQHVRAVPRLGPSDHANVGEGECGDSGGLLHLPKGPKGLQGWLQSPLLLHHPTLNPSVSCPLNMSKSSRLLGLTKEFVFHPHESNVVFQSD